MSGGAQALGPSPTVGVEAKYGRWSSALAKESVRNFSTNLRATGERLTHTAANVCHPHVSDTPKPALCPNAGQSLCILHGTAQLKTCTKQQFSTDSPCPTVSLLAPSTLHLVTMFLTHGSCRRPRSCSHRGESTARHRAVGRGTLSTRTSALVWRAPGCCSP